MLYHNIDNFTSQAATHYSSINYLVDRNRILGLICQRDVRCVDVSVLIQTRCLNPSSFVTENISKMGIKFAEIPRDLLILCCWEGGGEGWGRSKKHDNYLFSPLTKYSVIHPLHWGLLSCHNDRENTPHPPPHICDTTIDPAHQHSVSSIFGYLDICSVEV